MTLSGDYSAPQEPVPDTLVFPESVIGALAMVVPFVLAPVVGVASWWRWRRARILGLAGYAVDYPAVERDIANAFLSRFGSGARICQRPARFGKFALEPAALLDEVDDARRQLRRRRAQRRCGLAQHPLFLR